MKIKAVTYCRYSSAAQNDQSIDGQLRDNYAFAEREGYQIVAQYIDRARSGKTDNRDEFQRMIEDAAKRQFEIVIVWKLDRFARNRYDSAMYKAKLKKYNVRVVSAMENITDTPEGIILEGLLESMAEYYSANLAVNVKRGMRESAVKGKFAGGSAPYGYIVKDGYLAVNERTAPYVRYIFEQYASGVSKVKIAEDLNRQGIISPKGGAFTDSSFNVLLKNTTYYGLRISCGQEINVPPIISKELFDKAQLRIKAAKQASAKTRARADYVLQGKLICGHCGAKLIGECGRSGHSESTYYYYSCANRKGKHTCEKRNEKKEALEDYVIRRTVNYVLAPDNLRRIAKGVVEEYDREFSDTTVQDLESEIKRLDMELNKLVDAIIDMPESARPRIAQKMELLESQKQEAEIDLAKAKVAKSIRYTEQEIEEWLKLFVDGNIEDPSYRRRIVETFISKIIVYEDRILILYNLKESTPPPTDPTTTNPDQQTTQSKGFEMEHSKCTITNSRRTPTVIFMKDGFGCIFYENYIERGMK